jgi:hypothetical protein
MGAEGSCGTVRTKTACAYRRLQLCDRTNVDCARNLSVRSRRTGSRARSNVSSHKHRHKSMAIGEFAVVLIFILVDIVRSASTWLIYEDRSIYK